MSEMRNAYKILTGTPGRNRQQGKDEKIMLKWILRKQGVCVCVCVDWIHLSQDMIQGRGASNKTMDPRVL